MTDIISDGFQGPSGLDETLHAGMAECMRPQSWPDNAGLVQIVRGPGGDGSLSDGRAWGGHMKEDLT